jgi:hypothetical protein
MTTAQIVILVIVVLVILLGYVKTMLSENDGEKYIWGLLQLFFTFLLAIVAFLMTYEREKLLKQLKDKCPEYEKIENVYRLKQ